MAADGCGQASEVLLATPEFLQEASVLDCSFDELFERFAQVDVSASVPDIHLPDFYSQDSCSEPSKSDTIMINDDSDASETTTTARITCIGLDDGMQIKTDKENLSATEYSYDPVKRYQALAHTLRSPRGSKSEEHLEILRQSNPCLGSLTPKKTLAAVHELSYEPLERWAALARTLRSPRGAKSEEHLEILRQSNPCLGSLTPKKTLAAVHELSYEPLERWAALARTLRPPRGAKSEEHLEILRQSNPDYGTLAPRARAQLTLLELSAINSAMKRNVSVDSFVCDDDDDVADLPSAPLDLPVALQKMREWRRLRRDSDGEDSDSDRSAARTMERASNDTIESFSMHEHLDGASSGEWYDIEGCVSPRLLPHPAPAFKLPAKASLSNAKPTRVAATQGQ